MVPTLNTSTGLPSSHTPIPPSSHSARSPPTDMASASPKPPGQHGPSSRLSKSRTKSQRFIQLQSMLTQAKRLMTAIREFDRQFEQQTNHPPRKLDRQPISDKVEQYKAIRNDLRNCAATIIQATWRRYQAQKLAKIKRQEKLNFLQNPATIIEERLKQKRTEAGRDPSGNVRQDDVIAVREEKNLVKSELKRFDKVFSKYYNRQPERKDKEPLRKLYQRYKVLTNISKSLGGIHGTGDGDDDNEPSSVPPPTALSNPPSQPGGKIGKTKK